MTTAVEALLEAFDALSDDEHQAAAVEIIRRMTQADGDLREGVLLESSDALFCMLDAEETVNAGR
jgi:hypothetical protein